VTFDAGILAGWDSGLLRSCSPFILGFVGAIQLRLFGAQIYVAHLVGIATVREIGAVMTGVIVTGRTGASFAAQLGTMQVNEEIDADPRGARRGDAAGARPVWREPGRWPLGRSHDDGRAMTEASKQRSRVIIRWACSPLSRRSRAQASRLARPGGRLHVTAADAGARAINTAARSASIQRHSHSRSDHHPS
jgi:hypothetical protein